MRPLSLLNIVSYWKNSKSEACAKKLSQMLASNIGNERRVIGLKIYVRYCSYSLVQICGLYDLCSEFSDGSKFENFFLNMVGFGGKNAKQKNYIRLKYQEK